MHYISNSDLDTKCWWCGNMVKGFDVSTGKDIHTKHRHFCNDTCYQSFRDCPFEEEGIDVVL